MRKINIYTSLFLMLLAIAICIGSVNLSIYTRHRPGPGFMGFWTGGLIFLFSLHLFLKNLLAPKEEILERPVLRNKKVTIWILCSLIFYAFFLEKLGYILDLFIVLSSLFAISKTMKWYTILGSSLFISFCSFILFSVLLGIALPVGILKFLK
jgi:hypothetical protein